MINPPNNAPSAVNISQKPSDLLYLQLQDGRPTVTELVRNYPNPFNPETWIAYTLVEESMVNISIYTVRGDPIRLIELGVKSAGVYIEKDSAAYWDGRTDAGEPVSSGVYFYSLITDSSIYTKKMIILK